MFEKTLQDLVKGIRSHKRDPSAFISQSIQEIKQELRSTDPFVKGQAVRKLTYLQMMGYDMSWASFAVVEVMSSSRFAHKRIGYLAACQTFTETTDVVLLTTNLLKKEFLSPNQYEVGIAVNCLANIVTKDLARDLIGDVVSLIGHSKPYVRKKSVLSLYKLYTKYPQGLRLTFEKLKEKLEDAESAVVSCAVNVICELANKNPKNYLAMAPKFFRLLTTSSNNWMLIKVVKLLGSLVPEEPRLARKLLEPLATIIQNTAAKSLLYECIHTVTLALPFARKADGTDSRNVQAVVNLCSEHLRQFVEDSDQNLKYLGLVGFVNLMKSHPKAVVDHKELVLACLSDDDVTIRMKALELLTGMVTKRNLTELVHKLMQHALLAEGQYRDEIITKIIFMCSRDKYAYLTDVPWYVSVLVDLSYIQGPVHGSLVAAQLIDVSVRAESVREYAVHCMLGLLLDSNLFMGQSQTTISNVLYAAGWIVGEYADNLAKHAGQENGDGFGGMEEDEVGVHGPDGMFYRVLKAYLDPRATNLPETVQVVYMQNAIKVFSAACRHVSSDVTLELIITLLRDRLLVFMQSVHVEVQERATTFRNLLSSLGILAPEQPKQATPQHENTLNLLLNQPHEASGGVSAARLNKHLLHALSAEQLQPVNPKAQRKVPMPEGLDLEAPFSPKAFKDLLDFSDGFPKVADLSSVCFTHVYIHREVEDDPNDVLFPSHADSRHGGASPAHPPAHHSDEFAGYQVTGGYEAQKAKWQATPFYLSSGAPTVHPDDVDIDSIPMIRLTSADLEGRPSDKKGRKDRRGKGHRKHHPSSSSGSLVMPVLKDDVMPEGAKDSDSEGEKGGKGRKGGKGKRGGASGYGHEDDLDLKDIDITTPLRPDELMPRMEHRASVPSPKPSDHSPQSSRQAAGSGKGKEEKRSSKQKGASSGHASKSSRHKGAASPASEAPLIDLDDFGPPSSSGGGGGGGRSGKGQHTQRDSMETSQLKASAMDLLNFGEDPVEQVASTSTKRPPTGPPSHAPQTPQREGGSRMMDYLGLESPLVNTGADDAQGGTGKGRRKGKSGGKREKGGGAANGDHGQPKASGVVNLLDDAALGGGATGGGGTVFKAVRLTAVKSKVARVEYTVDVDHGKRKTTIQFRVKNTGDGPLSDVMISLEGLSSQLGVGSGGSLSPAAGASDTWQVARSIGGGETAKGSIVVTTPEALERSVALPAVLRYSTGNLLDGTSQAQGRLRLPCAAFLVPGSLTPSALTGMLAGGDVTWHSEQLKLSRRRSFETALEQVASFFRAQVVETSGGGVAAASLYCKTFNQQEHVAILLKGTEGHLSLAIKCTAAGLAQELAQDAQTALPSL